MTPSQASRSDSNGVQRLRRCPKCGNITERVSHCFEKGHPMFPQTDDYTMTEPCDVIEAKVTNEMVERLRESLWSTWGSGRQTTDWPSHDHLRAALEAVLR